MGSHNISVYLSEAREEVYKKNKEAFNTVAREAMLKQIDKQARFKRK